MTAAEELLDLDFDTDATPPVSNPDRYRTRWTLAGAGMSNVWRFGDLDLRAHSGRLLLRGANGTGKTTALEALAPYLLDLNPRKLAAGKARSTTLSGFMSEGAHGKRRIGYVWLTFSAAAEPGTAPHAPEQLRTWGVRLQYSPNASPQIKPVPFTVPGRPLVDLDLYGPNRGALSAEEFTAAVTAAGGEVFDTSHDYVADLARTVWNTHPGDLEHMAALLRNIRNPSILASVSPNDAAATLRDNLPGVDPSVLDATAEALAASDATREAFTRDKDAAAALDRFARAWTGHVADVVTAARDTAQTAHTELASARRRLRSAVTAEKDASAFLHQATARAAALRGKLKRQQARLAELERSEEFQAATELTSLREQLRAENTAAETAVAGVRSAAARLSDATSTLRRDIDDLAADIADTAHDLPREHRGDAGQPATAIRYTASAREPVTIGRTTINVGDQLSVTTGTEDLSELADHWEDQARAAQARADAADLGISQYRNDVAAAVDAAHKATEAAAASRNRVAEQQLHVDTHTNNTHTARDNYLAAASSWAHTHPRLAPDTLADTPPDDVTAGDETEPPDPIEPAQLIELATTWRTEVTETANRHATDLAVTAAKLTSQAETLTSQAAEYRSEADRLRSGELLPIPRPDWAGVTDKPLIGDLLDWAPNTPATLRDPLEVALVVSGFLGATLTDTDATGTSSSGATWHLNLPETTHVTDAARTLADVLTCPTHEGLQRLLTNIPLLDPRQDSDAHTAFFTDGTFRLGWLSGDPLTDPTAADRRTAPEAGYVGAKQRKASALARATTLDTSADDLERQARKLTSQATAATRDAEAYRAAARTFPDPGPLISAEAARVAAVNAHAAAQDQLLRAEVEQKSTAAAAQTVRTAWVQWCAAMDLPADLDGLHATKTTHTDLVVAFGRAGRRLRTQTERLTRLHRTISRLNDDATAVASAARDAAQMVDRAARTAETVTAREETLGKHSHEILDLRDTTAAEVDKLETQLPVAEADQASAVRRHAEAEAEVATSKERHTERVPAAAETVATLRELLTTPGVMTALGPADQPPPVLPVSGDDEEAEQLIAVATQLLQGHRPVSRKVLNDRYDLTKAELAGVWTLDHDEGVGALSTFVLTYGEDTYDPAAAAAKATAIAARAEEALRDAEEKALREFIIGRLPSAIGLAWQRILDWKTQVNEKMKDASASSGVGVKVDIVRDQSLSPTHQKVFELCCRVTDADRTPEQAREVGEAIRALIEAAEGSSTAERVAAAVDVREWADVTYLVTRPGQDPKPWGSRTGLSGGERRLVVLAPMLAAIAAGWDALGPTGLRLVTLDEVPAEVDDTGREGLARYLAALDLDLICTSYLWDGAPGAWDGIDAWDLEAAEDGMVVGFPALIRSRTPLPGEEHLTVPDPGTA